MDDILRRIERELDSPGLASILGEKLAPTDLQSLLLEVCKLRSAKRRPTTVLAEYEDNRFVRPSKLSPRTLNEWERTCHEHLPEDFEPVQLSPVSPLGTSSTLTDVPQNWVVATTRHSEVVSDATNVLALECALRRRQLLRADPKSVETVKLASNHRHLRAQPMPGPRNTTHFGIFALCSAGRDTGNLRFEFESLREHVDFHVGALRAFAKGELRIEVAVSNLAEPTPERLEDMASKLSSELTVEVRVDPERTRGRGYYRGPCFMMWAFAPDGEQIELVDGGVVDWTQQLLSNRKERLFTSGIGGDRVCAVFGSER